MRDIQVWSYLDAIHIGKNVCDAILGKLMNISGEIKDVKVIRDYFECKGLPLEFWPQFKVIKKRNRVEEESYNNKGKGKEKFTWKKKMSKDVEKNYFPLACYTLCKEHM